MASSSFKNFRAYQLEENSPSLTVQDAPYTPPKAHQVVVRAAAVAINPIDTKLQKLGTKIFPFIKYPLVLGSDVAGEIVEVGSDVKDFKVGDRITGMPLGVIERDIAQMGFQNYVVMDPVLMSKIPDFVEFIDASVIPLAISTAAGSLYQKTMLNLSPPLSPHADPTEKVVLIWGGASSVGTNAIQLAKASGYEVITTCSAKNFDCVKSVGADYAVDYSAEDVAEKITAAFGDKELAGTFVANGDAKTGPIVKEVLSKAKGNKLVAMAIRPAGDEWEGVEFKRVFGADIAKNEVGPMIFRDFLPAALQNHYKLLPQPKVVGHGLEKIQAGFDTLDKGVGTHKVVVTL